MLSIENTKNLAGVTLSGTYDDFYELYHSMSNVLGPPPETDSMTALRILGICYDLRHCFMGHREAEITDNGFHDELQEFHGLKHPSTNVHYRVNLLWMEVMFAALALDDYTNSYGNDKIFSRMMKEAGMEEDQKLFYDRMRLEDIAQVRLFQAKVWKAFREASGEAAYKRLYKKAKETEGYYVPYFRYKDFCTHYIDELEMKYLYAEPEKREKLLPRLIKKMIERGEDYYELHRTVSSYAATNNIDPSEVRLVGIEYPQDLDW